MRNKKLLYFLWCILFSIVLLASYRFITQYKNTNKDAELCNRVYKEKFELCKEINSNARENPDKCIKEAKLKLDGEINNFKIGMYNEAIGRAYIEKEDIATSKKYFNEAIEKYNIATCGEKLKLKLYMFLAELYMVHGDYTDAITYSYNVLDITNSGRESDFTKLEKEEGEIITSIVFQRIFIDYGLQDKANVYYEKINSIDEDSLLYKKYKDMILYSKFTYEINLGDKYKAKEYIDEIYNMFKSGEIKNQFIHEDNIMLDIVRTKIEMKDTTEILELIEKLMKSFDKNNNLFSKGMCYVMYGDYYYMFGKYEETKLNYDKANKIFEQINYDNGVMNCCDKIIKMQQQNKISTNIEPYYKQYFICGENIEKSEELRKLISDISDINEELNNIKLESLSKDKIASEDKNKVMRKVSFILIAIIIFMIIILYQLKVQIKRRKESEKLLKENMNTDYLTECYNKAYGYEILNELIKNGEEFYLAMLDIDDFKKINDNKGHMFGDTVLNKISLEIKNSLCDDDFIIRFGGEEFIIVLRHKDNECAVTKLENIRIKIENMRWDFDGAITISAGMAKYNGEEVKDFLVTVDRLLYLAKKLGKNRIEKKLR